MKTPPDDDVVTLCLPPSARWIRIARLVVTGVANSAGFGVDALEDARVAIDEACGILVEREPPSMLNITFRQLAASIEIAVSCEAPADCSSPTGLAAEVLEAVTTSWELQKDADQLTIRLLIGDEPRSTGVEEAV